MKHYILLQIIILGICFFGCSSQKAVIMSSYEDKELTDKTLSIVKPLGNINIQNPDDVTDDLGEGDPKTVYFDFLKNKLLSAFRDNSYLNNIEYIDNFQTSDFQEKVLSPAKDSNLTVFLPIENSRIAEIKSEFVLFFYNIDLYRSKKIVGLQGQSLSVLNHKIEFVLWDNIIGSIVSYGILKEEEEIMFGMDKIHWESVIEMTATDIIDFSLFQRKYYFKNF